VAIVCWSAPIVALAAGLFVVAAVIALPLALFGYRLVAQRVEVSSSGVRVRGVLADGWYSWSEIQGFRLVDHASGFSVATLGLPGSTVVMILRGGVDKRLAVTLAVKGMDRTDDGEPLAEALAREFEGLRSA
jgi:hypothetical protein